MPIKIISESHVVECVEHHLCFAWNDSFGGGFSFPCDENGVVDESALQPEGLENYHNCLDGTNDVTAEGLRTHRWSYREPRVGRCDCGREVELSHFTNTCECGADYNTAGQRLAPRSQWGEETGESWYDCY